MVKQILKYFIIKKNIFGEKKALELTAKNFNIPKKQIEWYYNYFNYYIKKPKRIRTQMILIEEKRKLLIEERKRKRKFTLWPPMKKYKYIKQIYDNYHGELSFFQLEKLLGINRRWMKKKYLELD